MIEIHCDGACKGNPGPGGWALIMIVGGEEFTFSGNQRDTTNNRMELTAAVASLRLCRASADKPVRIHTDSKYVIKGITEWIHRWKQNGWRNSKRKPVENKDLWVELHDLAGDFKDLSWEYEEGHAGNRYNEQVDELASGEAFKLKDHIQKKGTIMHRAPECPYCGKQAVKVTGDKIYHNDAYKDKTFWQCPGDCDAYVGAHKDGRPLGYPANKQLRDARHKTHEWFDGYWKYMGWYRTVAYGWLAEQMGLTEDKCHIGMFDLRQCEEAINTVKKARGIPVQGVLPGLEDK